MSNIHQKKYEVPIELIFECVLPKVQSVRDGITCSCKSLFKADALCRTHITIALCYCTTPERLHERFPSLHSLKIKGKPRASMYDLFPNNWGANAQPWVTNLSIFKKLTSLHFRRMTVTDADLTAIAHVKHNELWSLKLDSCTNITTDGLLEITRCCRNLRTLSLEGSNVRDVNTVNTVNWFKELSISNNGVFQSINTHLTSLPIKVEDLNRLASRCPLVSVIVGPLNLVDLTNFFSVAPRLREFGGLCLSTDDNIELPPIFPELTFLGLNNFRQQHLSKLFPFSRSLLKLDLVYSWLSATGHIKLLRECTNLEDLKTTTSIEDEGLEVVGQSCRRLKRLRVERPLGDELSYVTHTGLIHVAQGCPHLEYLAINVSDITNEAFERVGQCLTNLNDFRIVLLNERQRVPDLPLDRGVRALVRGCTKLSRLTIYLREKALTNAGLRSIGEFSRNIQWMLLGHVGESDEGLMGLLEGCRKTQKLEKLEMKSTCFTEQALVKVAQDLFL